MIFFADLFHPLPPCADPAVDQRPVQLAVTALGKKLGGMGLVDVHESTYGLMMLSPGGLSLFHIHGPPLQIESGIADWVPWLGRLPIERDLRVMFTDVPESGCRAPHGRLRTTIHPDGWTPQWHGRGGAVKATRAGNRTTLDTPVYSLLVVDAT